MATQSAPLIANRYQLLSAVGHGGMGIVYRALDRLKNQEVALKSISSVFGSPTGCSESCSGSCRCQGGKKLNSQVKLAMAAATLQVEAGKASPTVRTGKAFDSIACRLALAQEFRTLASLRHPHIISVLDYGFDADRTPFYTMELLLGARPLLSAAKDLSMTERIVLLAQVAQALAYLHRRGVVHRDLKPANILGLMTPAGIQTKLLDFGLAVVKSKEGASITAPAGTLSYMAPEILCGGEPSEASDLYAFGVTAYELLAGHALFEAIRSGDLVVSTLQPPDLRLLDIPAPMRVLLSELLATNPADRLADGLSLCTRLAKAAGLGVPVETSSIRDSYLQSAAFVTRHEEIELLMGALNDAMVGRGSGWLVGGESGVGKSRLIDEVRTQALVHGALVLRGEASRTVKAPYQALRDILRALCLQISLNDAQTSLLLPLLPDLPQLLQRPVEVPSATDAKTAQERLLQVIVAAFDRIAKPTVVIIEDLQWSGVEDIVTLSRLMRHSWKRPVVLIASYRADDAPWLPSALPGMETLKLARFNREGISTLSESMLGPTGQAPELIDFLERETEGNVEVNYDASHEGTYIS